MESAQSSWLDFDYDSQLEAIYGLLYRQEKSDDELAYDIANTEEFVLRSSGDARETAVDQWVELVHTSVYQDAAHSMATVGMLAPVAETVFKRTFWTIKKEMPYNSDIAKNIANIVREVGLEPYLPKDFDLTLEALFAYRNKMFHHGFEWPEHERCKFENRLKSWPTDWFGKSISDNKPWMFYMSPKFIRHCLYVITQCVDGIEKFLSYRNV